MPFYPVGAGGASGYILRIIADDASFANKTFTVKDSDGNTLKTGTMPSSLTTDIKLMENGNIIVECDNKRALCTINNPFGIYKAYLKVATIYTLVIDESLSDPYEMCSYEDDCKDFTPAYMDYNSGEFNYGSWENVFFMPKPCMVKTNGTVDYYLNPNNFKKKVNGDTSDVTNNSYGGNAMIEFPTIWTYVRKIGSKIYISISNVKAGDGYTAYAFHDRNGNVRPYRYYSAYEGSLYNSKMRSLSGKTCYTNVNFNGLLTAARSNSNSYDILTFSAYSLLRNLIWLISKDLNSQKSFGKGISNANQVIGTGSLDDKGMFWGSNSGSDSVKVFGIENLWGNIYTRVAGWVCYGNTNYIKLTYGTEDGSTVTDYPASLTGMISTGITTTGGGYYINTMSVSNGTLIPLMGTSGTTATTKYCDKITVDTAATYIPAIGGYYGNGEGNGISCAYMASTKDSTSTFWGSRLDLIPSAS